MKRSQSQPGIRAAQRSIDKVLERTGLSIIELAHAAVAWWQQRHHRRIKSGHVREVINAHRRGSLKPPKWLTDFIEKVHPEPQVA